MDKLGNRIGILGGSFDPIHIGHLILAEFTVLKFKLQKVLFIPSYLPPHKEKPLASSRQRYDMAKLAIMDNSKFEISEIEIKRKGISYSYDTLLELKKKYPYFKFYFILGSDAFRGLESWKNYQKLFKMADFIIATRPGSRIKKISALNVWKIEVPEVNLSSSYIRERIKAGLSIRYIVPDKVRDYILTYRLYR